MTPTASRRVAAALGILAVVAAMQVVTASNAGAATTGIGAGYVWASNPSTAIGVAYTPPAAYQYNSSSPFSAVNTVTRLLTGVYRVHYPNLGGAVGIAHTTAYGGDTAHCKTSDWHLSASGQDIEVECFTLDGYLVDHLFTNSFTNVKSSYQGRPMAYLIGDQPLSTVPYAPFPTLTFNSTGGSNVITRTGVGVYQVRMAGVGTGAGHIEVTGYLNTTDRCKSGGWWPDGSTEVAYVLCFDRTGNPVDTFFGLTYVDRLDILGISGGFNPDGNESDYAWADQPSSASYQPSTVYQYASGSTTAATGTRSGTGAYGMKFQSGDLGTGDAQVTAYGWGPEFCGIAYWNTDAGIQIRCYNAAGAPVDTYYNVAFTGPFVIG